MTPYIAPGTNVLIGTDDTSQPHTGTVISLKLTARGVEWYEVVWWQDGVRFCEALEPDEVRREEEEES